MHYLGKQDLTWSKNEKKPFELKAVKFKRTCSCQGRWMKRGWLTSKTSILKQFVVGGTRKNLSHRRTCLTAVTGVNNTASRSAITTVRWRRLRRTNLFSIHWIVALAHYHWGRIQRLLSAKRLAVADMLFMSSLLSLKFFLKK